MRSFIMGKTSKVNSDINSCKTAAKLLRGAEYGYAFRYELAFFASKTLKTFCVLALSASLFAGLSLVADDQALADLRICNKSESRVGISIGYRSDRGWTTEGWWNLEPTSCEVILPGDLKSQYYYMFAVDYDEGGEWAGSAYMCTADKIYTIHGIEDCLARGFQRTGFFEIDTGTQTSWTIQLTEPTQRGTGGK